MLRKSKLVRNCSSCDEYISPYHHLFPLLRCGRNPSRPQVWEISEFILRSSVSELRVSSQLQPGSVCDQFRGEDIQLRLRQPSPPVQCLETVGGEPHSTCAAGFGVCCVTTITECGKTITVNGTYISQPSTTQVSLMSDCQTPDLTSVLLLLLRHGRGEHLHHQTGLPAVPSPRAD